MVTAGTYLKSHYFKNENTLTFLCERLLELAHSYGWELHAWAVFSNHYHFIARSSSDPTNLKKWIAELHQSTSSMINQYDGESNKRIWYQFWDTKITNQTSYLARLNYVHQNPVKHGLVLQASQYRWCSAARFEMHASRTFVKSVYSFDYSKVKVFDEF